MSENGNVLLIDVGNTNIKLCLVDKQQHLLPLGSVEDVEVDLLVQHNIQKVLLCSVREVSCANAIAQVCDRANVHYLELKTEKASFGVKCAYANYRTMGVDRWMGVLAGSRDSNSTVLSISIGTAMTVDLVHRQKHIGGWIAPGYDLSKESLFTETVNVYGNNLYPDSNFFGTSTEDCVNKGCRAMINGLLHEALEQSKHYSDFVTIVVSGGGSSLVNGDTFPNLKFDELWIFRGMQRFI